MIQSNIKKTIGKIRDHSFRYLFLLACLTCASIGWTSARYTSDIYASSDSARSAKFSYTIKSTAFTVKKNGKESGGEELVEWGNGGNFNIFTLNPNNNDRLKVVFDMTLESEASIKFDMIRVIEGDGSIKPLKVDSAKLEKDGELLEEVINPTTPNRRPILSRIFEPSAGMRTIKCTVILSYPGTDDKYDLNLIPRITQVD